MHYLQQNILKILALKSSARYAELKPKTIESNHFLYHLNQLIRAGLIKKNQTKDYLLTATGRRYIDTISFESFKVRSQPKIVNLLICKNEFDEYIMYKRRHQPFIGMIGFIYGKIHLGESILESSERELKEKTGLTTSLRHVGDAYITVFEDETLITHCLHHIHYGEVAKTELTYDTSLGLCFWDKVHYDQPDRYFPGFLDILKEISRPGSERFFIERTFR